MSGWHLWLRNRVRDFVTSCTGPDWPGRAAQAQRLLAELPEETPATLLGRRAPVAPARARTGVDKSALPFAPPSYPTKRERNAVRNVGMRDARLLVMERASGRCEFCRVGEALDAHHVFGGATRRELESVYTLAAVCGGPDDPQGCHHRCNASPAWAREQGLAWARRMAAAAQAAGDAEAVAGFTATAEMLEGRIALAEVQARPVTTTPNTED